MGVFKKRPPVVTVERYWYDWWPRRPRTFWIEVGMRVKDRRIRHRDKTKVRAVCMEVDTKWKETKQ